MKKYNKQTVIDYINGNDINELSIDELENDPNFMKEVIAITKDKNMCNFCGDNVLKDYDFVKYVITTFKDDIPFITTIADNFLEQKTDVERDVEDVELNIIMEKIVGNPTNEELLKYRIANQSFYSLMQVRIEMTKIEEDFDDDRDFGMGFSVIENMYPSSKEIKNYFAERFIKDIFYNNENYPFEDFIHFIAKEKNNISEKNINSFINNVLSMYDTNLAWYMLVNNNQLDDIKKNIKKVYNNWDKKIYQQNTFNISLFEDLVRKFYEENEPNTPSYMFTQLEKYIIDMFNLKDIYLNSSFKDEYNEFLTDDEAGIKDIDTLNLTEIRFIKYASDLAKKIFINKENIDENEYLFPEKNNNVK